MTQQKLSPPSVESREIMIDKFFKHWEYTWAIFQKRLLPRCLFILVYTYTLICAF